jgi:hypothetical protein
MPDLPEQLPSPAPSAPGPPEERLKPLLTYLRLYSDRYSQAALRERMQAAGYDQEAIETAFARYAVAAGGAALAEGSAGSAGGAGGAEWPPNLSWPLGVVIGLLTILVPVLAATLTQRLLEPASILAFSAWVAELIVGTAVVRKHRRLGRTLVIAALTPVVVVAVLLVLGLGICLVSALSGTRIF